MKGAAVSNDIVSFIFNATPILWASADSLYVALHTDDPGANGLQSTKEASYKNYERVAVARSKDGWVVTGNAAKNAALIRFPLCGGGACDVTHISVGIAKSGPGRIIYTGPLSAPLGVSKSIEPLFPEGSLILTEQ
jgi:hypothetical protein